MEQLKIIFSDNNEITAEMNGSSFITDTKPEIPSFLPKVIVAGEEWQNEYTNAKLIECASVDDRYWFSFYEVPAAERELKQMQANIEYLSMMSDVDL